MTNEISISITGLSHDLASPRFPDHIAARGKSSTRGRGMRWSYDKISYEQAEEIAMLLRDAAKNINHISDSKNRAMEAFILRKDADKITNLISSKRKMDGTQEIADLCCALGEALRKAMVWMEGDNDDDDADAADALWHDTLTPALRAYERALSDGIVGEK